MQPGTLYVISHGRLPRLVSHHLRLPPPGTGRRRCGRKGGRVGAWCRCFRRVCPPGRGRRVRRGHARRVLATPRGTRRPPGSRPPPGPRRPVIRLGLRVKPRAVPHMVDDGRRNLHPCAEPGHLLGSTSGQPAVRAAPRGSQSAPVPGGLVSGRGEEHVQYPRRGEPPELQTGSALDRRQPAGPLQPAERVPDSCRMTRLPIVVLLRPFSRWRLACRASSQSAMVKACAAALP
jgi:hypothetical protein